MTMNSSEITPEYPNDGLTMLAGRRYIVLGQILGPKSLIACLDGKEMNKDEHLGINELTHCSSDSDTSLRGKVRCLENCLG